MQVEYVIDESDKVHTALPPAVFGSLWMLSRYWLAVIGLCLLHYGLSNLPCALYYAVCTVLLNLICTYSCG